MKGILGRKVGMTQVFTKDGELVPVTVIEVEPNVVTQIKTKETDGYEAIQLGFSTKREKLSNRPEIGHVKKANTAPKRFFKEIRGVDINAYQLGQEIKVDIFEVGEIVDVTGISKGKGFQGVIKRHNFARGPMSHGSHFHRRTGSLGTRREKRTQLGHKMPGHMGQELVTLQNLEVISVDPENNVMLIKGNVPGPKKSLVVIKTAIKKGKDKKRNIELMSYEVERPVEEPVTTNKVEENNEVPTEEVVTEEVLDNNETDTVDENTEQSSQEEINE